MSYDVKVTGADAVAAALMRLPPEVVSKGGGPVRAALRKAATVIRNQAMINLQASIAAGATTDSTGATAQNIIIKRKAPRGGIKGERYIVTVRPRQHPASKGIFRGRPIQFNDIAFMLESGTSTVPAQPWMLPAFNAKAPEAIAMFDRELPKAILRVAKKNGFNVEGL